MIIHPGRFSQAFSQTRVIDSDIHCRAAYGHLALEIVASSEPAKVVSDSLVEGVFGPVAGIGLKSPKVHERIDELFLRTSPG